MTSGGDLARKSLSIAKRDLLLMATNVATGIVVARLLGPAAFGVWAVFQLVLSYAEAFGRPRFDQAAVYFIGRGLWDAGAVAFALQVTALASAALLVGLAALGFEGLYGLLLHDAPDVRLLFWLVLLQIPLQFVYLNYAYLHVSREDIRAYNRMTVTRSVANAVLAVLFLAVFGLGLTGVVLAMIVSTLIGIAYGALRFHRFVRMTVRWNWRLVRDLGGYGARMYVAGGVGQLSNQLTNAICAVALAPAALAFFSIASARRDVLGLVPNALSTILFPRISSLAPAEAARLTALSIRVLVVTMAGIVALAMLFIGPVVALLYGPPFLPVVQPFLLLAPAFAIVAVVSPTLQYFQGTGRPDLTVKVGIPPVLLQLALAATLVPAWQLTGAAIALAAASVFGALLALVTFLRLSQLSLRDALAIRAADLRLIRSIAASEIARYRPRRKAAVAATSADRPTTSDR